MAGMIRKILRAAVTRPWEYVSAGAPDEREVRMSPDGRHIAIWEPGNEPWFVIDTEQVQGRWVETPKMDRHASDWERFVSVEDPDE